MLRSEWKFQYTIAQLRAAATAQHDFRNDRVLVWEGQKAAVIAKIKDSGINVSDSLTELMNQNTAKYLGTTTRGRGASITIDVTMQDDLNECVDKIRHHGDLRRQYSAWMQLFEAQPAEATLELDHDDWMFFFGK